MQNGLDDDAAPGRFDLTTKLRESAYRIVLPRVEPARSLSASHGGLVFLAAGHYGRQFARVEGLDLVGHFQVEPELRGGPKGLRKKPCHFGRNGATTVNDVRNRGLWLMDGLGQAVLRDPHGLEELLDQDLAGRGDVAIDGSHRTQSSRVL